MSYIVEAFKFWKEGIEINYHFPRTNYYHFAYHLMCSIIIVAICSFQTLTSLACCLYLCFVMSMIFVGQSMCLVIYISYLHCSRWNKKDVVEYLLADCHVDPNCTTKNGSPPLSLTDNTAIIRLLLQYGAKPSDIYKCSSVLPDGSPREAAQSNISVFMVGDKGAGKSTLTKALTTEKTGIARLTGRVSKVSGVKERTAGIECLTVHSSRIGRLSIYDLAGHREFHNAHDTVIRSSLSGLSLGLFLFVVNLGALLVNLKGTVSYWLSFIQSQVSGESGTLEANPYLLAIGSHADTVKSKSELKEKESLIQIFCKDAKNLNFVDYVRVDCRYSESSSLNQLRTLILTTHNMLQTALPKVSFHDHCFHVYLVSECRDKPALQLKDLMTSIERSNFSSKEFLPQTLLAVSEACNNLNKRGVMLYIQTQTIENSWIIIDKDMLLREVNGSVFAPAGFVEHKSLTQTGVVPLSKIERCFPQFDSQLILDFLVHMEFCRQVIAEDGLKLVTQTHPEYSHEPHFLFPGLTPQDPPPDIWQPNPLIRYSDYSSCWTLQCLEHHHYLTPRFQQVLLLRLAFTQAFPVKSHKVDTTSPALQQACNIWRKGIKWTTRSSVDALVEMTDRTLVVLLRCGQGKEMQLVKLRSQVMVEIQSVKREFCSHVLAVGEFIPNPRYPVITQSSVSLDQISHAIACHKDSVMLTLDTPFSISKLLYFEPYSFCNQQALVDLYSKQLVSCKVTSSFIENVSCEITSVDDFCTALNIPLPKVEVDSGSSNYLKAVRMFQEWQTGSEGTYQCFRQQMDKCSIFSGRNILVYTV